MVVGGGWWWWLRASLVFSLGPSCTIYWEILQTPSETPFRHIPDIFNAHFKHLPGIPHKSPRHPRLRDKYKLGGVCWVLGVLSTIQPLWGSILQVRTFKMKPSVAKSYSSKTILGFKASSKNQQQQIYITWFCPNIKHRFLGSTPTTISSTAAAITTKQL